MVVVHPVQIATGETAHRYASLLKDAVDGHALWLPSKNVRLGDCGTVHDGLFSPLFNVYDASSGLPCLPPLSISNSAAVPDSTGTSRHLANGEAPSPSNNHIRKSVSVEEFNPADPRPVPPTDGSVRRVPHEPPKIFSSSTSLKMKSDASANVDVAEFSANLRFSASLETSDLAFLLLRGQERIVARLSLPRIRQLERYLATHYSLIERKFNVQRGDLVIVHGCEHACGWVNGVSHRRDAHSDAQAGVKAYGAGVQLGHQQDRSSAVGGFMPEANNIMHAASHDTGTISSTAAPDSEADRGKEGTAQGGGASDHKALAEFPGLVEKGPIDDWNPNRCNYCVVIQPVHVTTRDRFTRRITVKLAGAGARLRVFFSRHRVQE